MYLANGDKSFGKERIEVFSGGKIAILDDFRSLNLIHKGIKKTHKSRFRQDKGHHNAWTAFINAIQDGAKPPIPYDQLVHGMVAAIVTAKYLNKGTINLKDHWNDYLSR